MADDSLARAAARWSRDDGETSGTRWWSVPRILRHVNGVVCGKPLDGLIGIDVEVLMKRAPLWRGISVGCGTATKELGLLKNGIVGFFDLYEIAEARVERGKAEAARMGLESRITWHSEPPDFAERGEREFDLVYWNNALHHMADTRAALEWSRGLLARDGTFFMNDYVGPDRMQWTDEMVSSQRRSGGGCRAISAPIPRSSTTTRRSSSRRTLRSALTARRSCPRSPTSSPMPP